MLAKTAPPNLPRRIAPPGWPGLKPVFPGSLHDIGEAAAGNKRTPAVYLLAPSGAVDHIADACAEVAASGRSAVVVLATAVEAHQAATELARFFGDRVVAATPDLSDRELTRCWLRAACAPGTILVGTHRIALWPVADLGLAVIIEEGRRSMKDRQTPTIHAREILKTRARIERFPLAFVGRVPTTEVLRAGTEIRRAPGRNRMWQLVEVVDRGEEPPGSGLLTERVKAALKLTAARNERAFLFTHRHGYAPAARCVRCRRLRTCADCGARPDPGQMCARCGATLGACRTCGGGRFEPLGAGVGRVIEVARRLVGTAMVGEVGDSAPIVVGTERDLVGLGDVDLAVAVDADGLILGTNYRAAEEALRTLVRVAGSVPFGRGKRMMVQTSQPSHPVIAALRRGDPVDFLEAELSAREDLGFPPAGEIIVIEVRDSPVDQSALLAGAVADEADLYGPAPVREGQRWLIQGPRLGPVRVRLREAIQRIRDTGAVVRVDVDPLDL
jgi:primosomal protein N' (replication factor Y)